MYNQTQASDLARVVTEIAEVFEHRSPSLIELGTIIELYGSLYSVSATFVEAKNVFYEKNHGERSEPNSTMELDPRETKIFKTLMTNLDRFGFCLSNTGLLILDIFDPGIVDALQQIRGKDVDWIAEFNEVIEPRFRTSPLKVPGIFDWVEQSKSSETDFDNRFPLVRRMIKSPSPYNKQVFTMLSMQELESLADGAFHGSTVSIEIIDQTEEICKALDKCRERIGSIVRGNWTLREITEHGKPNKLAMEVTMGNEINISGGQVGAVGPQATAHDFTFTQQQIVQPQPVDLKVLAEQLNQVAAAAKMQATEPEHQMAIGVIEAAKSAAEKGDESKAMTFLNSAGRWTLGIATDIGAKVVAETIKAHIGLG